MSSCFSTNSLRGLGQVKQLSFSCQPHVTHGNSRTSHAGAWSLDVELLQKISSSPTQNILFQQPPPSLHLPMDLDVLWSGWGAGVGADCRFKLHYPPLLLQWGLSFTWRSVCLKTFPYIPLLLGVTT